MPCRDEFADQDYYSELSNRLNKITKVACEILTTLPAEQIDKFSTETKQWWEEHQRYDKLRIKREKAQQELEKVKQNAKAKLTPAERKALGL